MIKNITVFFQHFFQNRLNKKEIELFWLDLGIAVESILAHKLKSILTALGIVFGVAAVVAMLAIGNGAQQEILDQMKLVGVNNIIVIPKYASQNGIGENDNPSKSSPGLSLDDVRSIQQVIPNIKHICPQVTMETYAMANGKQFSVKLIGTDHVYFDLFGVELILGTFFSQKHQETTRSVCVISESLSRKLFQDISPINQIIKSKNEWFTIIGVYKEVATKSELSEMGIETSSSLVYIPIETMLLRIANRGNVTQSQIKKAAEKPDSQKEEPEPTEKNIHQLDKIVVSLNESKHLNSVKQVLDKILYRNHHQTVDFEIIIPELLLKQQQRTRDIFNLVLGAIAGISLLVGGIGIMNIMLASVMERVKEIGIRMAVGARKRDIIIQFIAEASLISLTGGFVGVILGLISAAMVTRFAEIKTVVTMSSVLISFAISVAIGIIFGYLPAKRAAGQDPIISLRSE
ncbi:MAG: ABC transporter permease [Salinivirgaceae bacterium]|nr:ABC transporter permease [Salinivirgaceae bacterium]MDD4746269.1 ABC transporter permease [Salinivirgaceae bacterium]